MAEEGGGTNTHTIIATYKLNLPKGWFRENIFIIFLKKQMPQLADYHTCLQQLLLPYFCKDNSWPGVTTPPHHITNRHNTPHPISNQPLHTAHIFHSNPLHPSPHTSPYKLQPLNPTRAPHYKTHHTKPHNTTLHHTTPHHTASHQTKQNNSCPVL